MAIATTAALHTGLLGEEFAACLFDLGKLRDALLGRQLVRGISNETGAVSANGATLSGDLTISRWPGLPSRSANSRRSAWGRAK
jgi:hypothetical protein